MRKIVREAKSKEVGQKWHEVSIIGERANIIKEPILKERAMLAEDINTERASNMGRDSKISRTRKIQKVTAD